MYAYAGLSFFRRPFREKSPHLAFFLCSGNFAESRGEIKFPEISTHILEKVIQYLYYKVRDIFYRSLVRSEDIEIMIYTYTHPAP
jgi:hypothetical protein